MNSRKTLFLSVVVASAVGGISRADWDPTMGHKMHYPQLPDVTETGINVNATWKYPFTSPTAPQPFSKILADDFRCTETGPINDVHIWGSWLNDQVFTGTRFKLSIHEDIPAIPGVPDSYSRPGQQLWQHVFDPGQYVGRIYSQGPTERFWDPNTNRVLGGDNQVWQYNFTNLPNPFVQQEGKIYWLDVQAWVPETFPGAFGWKTTNPQITPHFMDDAVYGDTDLFAGPPVPQFPDPNPPGPALTPWNDLVYPPGPFEFQSMDLAFVITPEPMSAGVLLLGFLLRRRR